MHSGAETARPHEYIFHPEHFFRIYTNIPDTPTGLYLNSYLPPDAGLIQVELPSCRSNSTCHPSVTGWHPKRASSAASCCVRSVKKMFVVPSASCWVETTARIVAPFTQTPPWSWKLLTAAPEGERYRCWSPPPDGVKVIWRMLMSGYDAF